MSVARALVVVGAVAFVSACSLIVGLEDREVASADAAPEAAFEAGTDTALDTALEAAPDAPVDATPDAPLDAGRCDPTKPFGAPVYVAEVSTPSTEEGAWPSPSNLELYVARREPNNDLLLHRYTRLAVSDIWKYDRMVAELRVGTAPDGGSPAASSNMAFTPDGLTAYLAVYEGEQEGGTWGTYVTHRPSLASAWSRPEPAAGLEAPANDQAPFLAATGNRIYFQTNRSEPSNFRIWSADVLDGGDGGFGTPAPIGVIAAEEDRFPVLLADELTIYFGAYRSLTDAEAPEMYLHSATRKSTSAAFTQATYEATLNVPHRYTAPTGITRDGCELYMVAVRQGYGGANVWVARRPP